MNSTRPTHSSSAGSAYLNLRKLARHSGRPTDELHQLYALEGFLARLAQSPDADRLILKGGVLLAAYDARRPTRDIDFHARRLLGDGDAVLELVRRVARLAADDGLTFDADGAIAETIRDEEQYAGVRVTMTAQLATARLRFHVDVNVGDPVHPEPQLILLPRLLGGSIQLLGYPLPMMLAEKIVTAVQRGSANTRWRDYADIYLLINCQEVDTISSMRRSQPSPIIGTQPSFRCARSSTATHSARNSGGQLGDESNSSMTDYPNHSPSCSSASSHSPTLCSPGLKPLSIR